MFGHRKTLKEKLVRDQRREKFARWVFEGGIVVAAILSLIRLILYLLGVDVKEFLVNNPPVKWTWFGFGIIYSFFAVYYIKKVWETDGASQLYNKPDHVLEEVLADPEMESWHAAAKKLLEKRGKRGDPFENL